MLFIIDYSVFLHKKINDEQIRKHQNSPLGNLRMR